MCHGKKKKKKKDPALEPEEQKVVPGDATMAVGTSWTVAEGPRGKVGEQGRGDLHGPQEALSLLEMPPPPHQAVSLSSHLPTASPPPTKRMGEGAWETAIAAAGVCVCVCVCVCVFRQENKFIFKF